MSNTKNTLRRSNMDNIQDRMKYTEQENKILMEVSELLGHLNEDTVTTCCGTDQFHMNMFWHNGRKRLFEGQDEYGDSTYWCHKCNADTSVTDDYEEEEEDE